VSGTVGCTTVWIELFMDDAHEAQARVVVAGATKLSLVVTHPADGRTPAIGCIVLGRRGRSLWPPLVIA
jgi:hypothetical protein